MNNDSLATALALSDGDLLTRIDFLARSEREATADLVAHLAALELRPTLYLARGYGSLFDYCTQALRMSEDTACNRIQITRVCRRFPTILDRLAAGSATLSSIRMLGPHLTEENHQAVLARAANRRRGAIEALVAELAPKPDVVASVRKVPVRNGVARHGASPASDAVPSPSAGGPVATGLSSAAPAAGSATAIDGDVDPRDAAESSATVNSTGGAMNASVEEPQPLPPLHANPRPTIRASAPGRYRVQFTIGEQGHEKLQRLQALLRREIPSGDPGVLFERMLDLYLEKVEKAKMGGTTRGNRIRRAADTRSRHIPSAVKRAVWFRDAGQCAFVSAEGRRCPERAFLELHHIHPYALSGPATAGNIALRCRRHNQYEAELVFASRTAVFAPSGYPHPVGGRSGRSRRPANATADAWVGSYPDAGGEGSTG